MRPKCPHCGKLAIRKWEDRQVSTSLLDGEMQIGDVTHIAARPEYECPWGHLFRPTDPEGETP